MSKMKSDLETLAKDLRRLQKKTEQMVKKLGRLEKSQEAKTKKKTARKSAGSRKASDKPKKTTAIGLVFGVIGGSRKGVGTAVLKEKTGFDDKKVYNCVNILKRKGMIKSAGRGLYMKA